MFTLFLCVSFCFLFLLFVVLCQWSVFNVIIHSCMEYTPTMYVSILYCLLYCVKFVQSIVNTCKYCIAFCVVACKSNYYIVMLFEHRCTQHRSCTLFLFVICCIFYYFLVIETKILIHSFRGSIPVHNVYMLAQINEWIV